MGNRNRPIGPSTVPGRAHCPSGGGGITPFGSASTTLYSLCPPGDVGLYEMLRKKGCISIFVVGRAGSEYGLPVAVYMKYSANQGRISSFVVGRAGSEYGLPVAVIKKPTLYESPRFLTPCQ